MHKLTKAEIMREVKDYIYITLGLISYSLGWAAFLLPYQITTGGTTGIGAIIYYATGFPIQWSYFIINAVLMTFAIREESFDPTAKFEQATVERKDAEYSYNDGDLYYFMDPETYDMVPLNRDVLGDAFRFVKENTVCKLLSYKGNVFGIETPNFVELVVTKADPGVKGDTATNVTKPATVETGAEIKVPLFINEGDKIQIDTRTGEYLGRAKG